MPMASQGFGNACVATPANRECERWAGVSRNLRDAWVTCVRRDAAGLRSAGVPGAGRERLLVLLQVLVDAVPGESPDEDTGEKLRI